MCHSLSTTSTNTRTRTHYMHRLHARTHSIFPPLSISISFLSLSISCTCIFRLCACVCGRACAREQVRSPHPFLIWQVDSDAVLHLRPESTRHECVCTLLCCIARYLARLPGHTQDARARLRQVEHVRVCARAFVYLCIVRVCVHVFLPLSLSLSLSFFLCVYI